MSRTTKHKVEGSRDLWGNRPKAGENKTPENKKACRKIERAIGKKIPTGEEQ